MTDVEHLEKQIQGSAEHVGPAVVGLGRGWGMGSGVVVAPGRVLTTAHNLRGGHRRDEDVEVVFTSDRRARGRVAGADSDLDLAVIDVDTGDVAPIEWAPEASAPLGRAVLALANPGGRGLHVTVRNCFRIGPQLSRTTWPPHKGSHRAHRAAPTRLVRRSADRLRWKAARDQRGARRRRTDLGRARRRFGA